MALLLGALGLDSLTSKKPESENQKAAKLIYRIDFQYELSTKEFKKLSSRVFNKKANRQIIFEMGCQGKIKSDVVRTTRYFQKTLTFPDRKALNAYLEKVNRRKKVADHNILLDSGHRVFYKIIS